MGSGDAVEAVEGVPSALTFKVHGLMCSELLKLVTGVSRMFSEIEAARPRCSSGIDALCLLNNGLVKSQSLLQHCSESSVLYLALTGDALLFRFKKSRKLLEDSLVQIQNMVPVMLSAKISGITAVIKSGAFRLDPSEEEAGRLLRELLHRYCSTQNSSEKSALASIHTVSSLLRISSQTSLLIEKRSIRKLLEKFSNTKPSKKNILLVILKLVNKYAKAISKEPKEYENPFPHARPYPLPSSGPELPEEFVCPLSSRLMCDPVIIASGQTYERMWIQKWFDEGHKLCPRTNENLAHRLFTPNAAMKALISKWCASHNMAVPVLETWKQPWESPANSVGSLSSSMNDLRLPLDFSGVSLGSTNEVRGIVDRMLYSEFSALPWDFQRHAVEEVMMLLRRDDEEFVSVVPSGKFVGVILGFLKDARELRDGDAQMTGCMLLSEFVQKDRSSISYLDDVAYALLASFLHTEASKQALHIIKLLSTNQQCHRKIGSALLTGIINILDGPIQQLVEPVLQILINLSDNGSSLISYELIIPKLIPLLEDDTLSRQCLIILKNLSESRQGRISIANTDGCLSSIARVLEKNDQEDQELAVAVLLPLYAECCKLAIVERLITCLTYISTSGNMKGKAMALDLLRILRDQVGDAGKKSDEDKNSRRKAGLFGKILYKAVGKK